MGSFGMLSADTKWSTLRLQNYYSFGGHFRILHGFVKLFCDWFWAFHSFWTHGVRVWIQINWITFRLTGTFKERKKKSANLRNTHVFWKTEIYCFRILWRIKNAQNSDLFLSFFIFADCTQFPKREYLNDDGESYCIRDFYRSYTRLHRYVHLVQLSILNEHFQQSFFKKDLSEMGWTLGWTLDICESFNILWW